MTRLRKSVPDREFGQIEKRLELAVNEGKRLVVLTDFDETVCSKYIYSQDEGINRPIIREDVAGEVKKAGSRMILATSRSTREPVMNLEILNMIGETSLPIICENGAVIIRWIGKGWSERLVVEPDEVGEINKIAELIEGARDLVDKEMEVKIKKNKAATVELRVHDREGRGVGAYYDKIAQWVLEQVDSSKVDVCSSGSSISFQPKNTSKGRAFEKLCQLEGWNREEMFVVGIGDAANDKGIFEVADLSVGVRPATKKVAEFMIDGGDETFIRVIKTVNRLGC